MDLEAGWDDADSDDEELLEELEQQSIHDAEDRRRAAQTEDINPDIRMGRVPHDKMAEPIAPLQLREGYDPATRRRRTQNTGPKGVKADYEEAKHHMVERMMMAKMKQQRELQQQANPTDLSGFKEHVNYRGPPEPPKKKDDSDEESDLSDLDSEDEDFQKYKMERIKAVQSSIPQYGDFVRLQSKKELASVIKDMHELCFCIVHIYENDVPACTLLNLVFESVAPQFPHIRFCRIRKTDCLGPTAQNKSLPTVMVYKGETPFKTYPKFVSYIQGEITDLRVAKFLASEGILSMPGGDLFKNEKLNREEDAERGETKARTKGVKISREYDPEDENY